jgi:hypothetical protein
MSPWKAFCHTVHVVALGLWMGTIVMAGATAAVLFPTMKGLDPRLPAFASFEGEHWRLAAGRIGQQVFLISDLIQFACAVLAIGTFLVLVFFHGLMRRRGQAMLRGLLLAVALAGIAGELLILAPSMNSALKAYWAAAQSGDAAAAAVHQKAFAELHPMATNVLVITLLAVAGALIAAAWTSGSGSAPAVLRGEPPLEEPALLRGAGA